VDETKGFLYVYGTNLYSGKALCFNISNPGSPTYAGKFDGPGYTHDGYADNDTLYSAHIYAGVVDMVNMSNKSAPVVVGTISTPNAFPHNTWRSGAYIYTTDEKSNAYLASYKRSNFTLADKIQVTPGSGSIVHNTYVHNEYAVTSWYRDGVVIVDVSRPHNMVVVGKYDTYPCASGDGFDGCWGVSPYLPSGNILISNILACGSSTNGEMMVFEPTYVRGCYVEGRVTRADNGNPITGATVKLLSTSTSETSDASGYYKMGQLQSGNFTARVSKSGFVTQDIAVTLSTGSVTVLNVALQQVPAPVELARFEAHAEGREAVLDWETASERDNSGFEVEHRAEPGPWQPAGWVPAQPDALGGARYAYRLPDLPAGTHFFRLRQMDLDGTATLSEQRGLRIAGQGLRVWLRQNPVTDGDCRVGISTEKAESLRVSLFNAYGQLVGEEQSVELEAGDSSWAFPVGGLASGTYRLVLRTEQGEVQALTLALRL
ncbi:MAG TPA: carboxypeptidase regulatory-like domain-containing protein, partial [Saprospiraceae bacterium]|nr:carboxypeptidase regulatory-like domain-containing protein [Saprospiraceae bacterium]